MLRAQAALDAAGVLLSASNIEEAGRDSRFLEQVVEFAGQVAAIRSVTGESPNENIRASSGVNGGWST